MTTKQELLALAERVEKGELNRSLIIEVNDALLDGDYYPGPTNEALVNGSLDAAKALHDAVLPGWTFQVAHGEGNAAALVSPIFDGTGPILDGTGSAPTPAAAWVAAILRAKAEEVE